MTGQVGKGRNTLENVLMGSTWNYLSLALDFSLFVFPMETLADIKLFSC